MNIETVRRLMRQQCTALGSQAEYARQARVHPQAISAVLTGKRYPTPAMLNMIGVECRLVYRRVRMQRNAG
jgi:hypothetical protein